MANTNKEIVRPMVNYPPDIWGDRFSSMPFNNKEFESFSKKVEELKAVVKDMLVVSKSDPIEKINLINSLYRLGVSYHYEEEIEEQLTHLFDTFPQLLNDNNCDLQTVALAFQVFRLHGYRMSCDVFSIFLAGDGKFKEGLIGDVKGMIALYEASHLVMNGELILDEALAFTTKHLGSLANQSSPHFQDHIENALIQPYHRNMQRLEARNYIAYYERDEARNDLLLKLAKYDFNRVQLLHQQELSVLSSWYAEKKMKSKIPYARHRVVELFFYTIGAYFEPRFAVGRNIIVKHGCISAYVDDVYDVYGLYEELHHLADVIQRFDIRAIEELSENYQRVLYETILDVHGDIENLLLKEGRSYGIAYIRDALTRFAKAQEVEARWRHEGQLPTFDEYMENGMFSGAGPLALTQIFLGMEEADENAYEWVMNVKSKFSKAFRIVSRLYNDIVTDEAEEKMGITGTASYMKQYNVSETEARKAFKAEIEGAWKEINEGCMRPTPIPMRVARATLDYIRSIDLLYRDNDSFTIPEIAWKDLITKVLLHPVPLD